MNDAQYIAFALGKRIGSSARIDADTARRVLALMPDRGTAAWHDQLATLEAFLDGIAAAAPTPQG